MQQQSNGTFWQSCLFDSKRNRIVMLAILVVSLVLGVASREALASSHNEPINGCYHTNSLTIRFADDEPCGNNEVALSWPSMNDFIALQVALADEAAQRQAADAALQAALAEEAALREAADSELGNSLAEEASLREAMDAELRAANAALEDQIAALQAQLDTEISNRQAGDTALQTALNTEIDNRIAGDSQTLQDANAHTNTAVAGETTARESMRNDFFSNLDSITGVLAALMNGDFDAAWNHLLALADGILSSGAVDAIRNVGNKFDSIIDGIFDDIAEVTDLFQTIWDRIFGEDPKEAN